MTVQSRRKLLHSVALAGLGSLSGCVSELSTSESSPCPEAEFTVETDQTPTSGFNTLEMDFDVQYDDHDVRVVGGITRQPSEDSPGRAKISFTNLTGDSRKFQFGPTPPFSPDWGTHTEQEARMVLVPTNLDEFYKVSVYDVNDDNALTAVPDSPTNSCWKLVDMVARLDVFVAETIDSCSSITTTYDVLGHPENEDCLPSGKYQFEDYWHLGDDIDTKIPLEATIRVTDA